MPNLCRCRVSYPLVIGVAVLHLLPAFAFGQPSANEQAEQNNTRPVASVVSIIDRGGCGNCHVIPGISGADGTVGPDLSALGKVAGSRKPNTSAKDYIRESILKPDAFIAPGDFESGIMPEQFGDTLSKEDVDRLVDFLVGLGVSSATTEKRRAVTLDASRPPETAVTPFATPPGPAPSDAQIALGRYFFFDRRLSASNALSCASCHQPDREFTDSEPVSQGYPGTKLFRNTPTLLNVVFAKHGPYGHFGWRYGNESLAKRQHTLQRRACREIQLGRSPSEH
jgi:mono/diheme cytochrome c family protein